MNGIKHTTSAPYHPSSNGLAERAVQIVKRGLKKELSGSMNTRLAKVLFSYRLTPQSTTGVFPSELLLGRRLRTRLDLLRPDITRRVEEKQYQHKVRHDRTAKSQVSDDLVYVKNFGKGQMWLPGKIVKVTGPVSFIVALQDSRQRRCHVDQLRSRESEDEIQEPEMVEDESIPISLPVSAENATVDATVSTEPQADRLQSAGSSEPVIREYPQRQRKQREWYEPGKD